MLLNLSLSFPYLGNGNNSCLEEICVLIIALNFIIYIKYLMIRRLCWYRKHSANANNSLDSPFLSSVYSLLIYFSKSKIVLVNKT